MLYKIISPRISSEAAISLTIFTWKPSDWEKNHRSFTNFRIYFARIKYWLGKQPLTIYLTENKDSCDTIYFPVSLGGAPTPYKPTV